MKSFISDESITEMIKEGEGSIEAIREHDAVFAGMVQTFTTNLKDAREYASKRLEQ